MLKANVVEQAAREAFKPADRRPPWKWAEDHYRVSPSSPFPGKWRSDNSPWVREIMEEFANDEVQTLSAMCSAQSAKTETMLALLGWLISEDPGPCMWVTSSEEEAGKFATERMWPSLESCPKIRDMMPTERGKRKAREIFFPTMPLEIIGSNAPGKLQSKPRRWLLLDEVRNWPASALPMVLKRTRAFWNARRVVISTPGMEHDHVHQQFLEGDQRHFYIECPECGHYQVLDWPNMKWEESEKTRPDGKWNFDALAETIFYQCEKGCKIPDSPAKRKKMVQNGEWRRHNTSAPKSKVSFTWSAMIPPWVRWRDLVEEFISANKALDWGDFEPLKAFICESLGQPWRDTLKYREDTNFLHDRMVNYNLREKWEEENRRFIGVDVQKDCLYFVCRAFGDMGASRLIDYGRITNFDELRSTIRELNVDDDDVVIDAAHRSQEVYREVAGSDYKWKAFWGDERHFFLYEKLRRSWSMNQIDPAIGTPMEGRARPIKLYHWSNPSIKDKLELMMRGESTRWEIPEKISDDYIKQLTAERRQEFEDSRGHESFKYVKIRKDDHLRDCEAMILVAATITEAIGFPHES
tara:strand:+ start:3477 stop:5222 length:1746 start_codon:yes stop_codon:yes gene_type:complete